MADRNPTRWLGGRGNSEKVGLWARAEGERSGEGEVAPTQLRESAGGITPENF